MIQTMRWVLLVGSGLVLGCVLHEHSHDEVDPCDEVTCSTNAACGGGQCFCDQGYEGDPYAPDGCQPYEPADGAVIQEWLVTDDCADGLDVEYRLWAWERDWVWPGPDEAFVTGGFGVDTYQTIECTFDELVCFGATAGDRSWGVGLDGLDECEDCCATCAADLVDVGFLGC